MELTNADRYLVGTMPQSAELERRLSAVGGSWDSLRSWVDATLKRNPTFRDPSLCTRDSVVAALGSPAVTEEHLLLYETTLWPDHWYAWRFGGSGRATGSLLVRRDATPPPRPYDGSSEAILAALRLWYHTERDVMGILGTPEDRDGWWPESVLIYAPTRGRDGLRCVFYHGLLVSVDEDATAARGTHVV